MSIIHIKQISDPHIAAYRELQDKNLSSRHGLFIAEGEYLVRRLFESNFEMHSVLVQESRLHLISEMSLKAPVFVASAELLSQIVGFNFHRGILALGVRKSPINIEAMLANAAGINRLVILPEINDVENLGGILRTCAALGYNHIVLGPSCCDAFARRAIRTSMGQVFKLKIARSENMAADLMILKQRHGYILYAAATGDSPSFPAKSENIAVLFGSEANGLPTDVIAACDDQVSIPMSAGVDSLNVVVAAGIILHHYQVLHPSIPG